MLPSRRSPRASPPLGKQKIAGLGLGGWGSRAEEPRPVFQVELGEASPWAHGTVEKWPQLSMAVGGARPEQGEESPSPSASPVGTAAASPWAGCSLGEPRGWGLREEGR